MESVFSRLYDCYDAFYNVIGGSASDDLRRALKELLEPSNLSTVRLSKDMFFWVKSNIERLVRFLESHPHNVNIKLLDPTKMTLEAYRMRGIIEQAYLMRAIFELFESWRLHELPLTAMTRCFAGFRALQFFLALMVESSDSKAKIQEIKAKIQDKFNYNGNCKVKIGIIPEGSGTPFLKMGILRPAPMFQKVYSAKLVLPSNWGQAYIPGI